MTQRTWKQHTHSGNAHTITVHAQWQWTITKSRETKWHCAHVCDTSKMTMHLQLEFMHNGKARPMVADHAISRKSKAERTCWRYTHNGNALTTGIHAQWPGDHAISWYYYLPKKKFQHVYMYISGYNQPITKKLVTKMKPFKFASCLRKPHLSSSMRSKVIQVWMKCFNSAFAISSISSNDITLLFFKLLLNALS